MSCVNNIEDTAKEVSAMITMAWAVQEKCSLFSISVSQRHIGLEH